MDRTARLSRRRWRLPPPPKRFLATAVGGAALLLAASCEEPDRGPDLYGLWQARVLTEESDSTAAALDTVEVNLDAVSIAFAPDGTYTYTSTLDYSERGTFRTEGDYLLTTPQVPDTIEERAVKIENLDATTLRLDMREGDKRRVLMFERLDQAAGGAGATDQSAAAPGRGPVLEGEAAVDSEAVDGGIPLGLDGEGLDDEGGDDDEGDG